MRIQKNDVWCCGKDHDRGNSDKFCTSIKRLILDRALDAHVRLRLASGQQFLDDLISLIEQREQEEDAKQAILRQKLANLQQAIDNFTAQLKTIDMRTEVGKYLFNELQERLAPLLEEKRIIDGHLVREKTILDRGSTSESRTRRRRQPITIKRLYTIV